LTHQRKKIDAKSRTAFSSLLFDNEGMVISDEKKRAEDNFASTPQLMLGNIGTTTGFRQTNDFDSLLRQHTGKSEMFAEEFEQMLGAGGMGLPSQGLADLKPDFRKQPSLGSIFNDLRRDHERMGETGTTPRNEIGNLFMNRNVNLSYGTRSNNQIISPFLDNSRQSILAHNPTTLRHQNSFL